MECVSTFYAAEDWRTLAEISSARIDVHALRPSRRDAEQIALRSAARADFHTQRPNRGSAQSQREPHRLARPAKAARDVLREYVVEQIGGRGAVLIVDEADFLKKGEHSAGARRQYSGTAGRIENSLIGVFQCYAGNGGSAFIDRELYVPQGWIDDSSRPRAAGVPDSVEFAAQPQLARRMLGRALDARGPRGWVTGDEV